MSTSDNIRKVMMIPLRRCGSHAIRLRLNRNPSFYAPYPLHITDVMEIFSRYGNLTNDKIYFQLITDLVGLQNSLMVKWPGISLDPVEIFNSLRDKPRNIHQVVWEMLSLSAVHQGASVAMDKSLDSIHYVDEIMATFPDMLFINVVRDPRAQIASMNRAIIYNFNTLMNAQLWKEAYSKSHYLAQKYPDRVLTIRFEDFISSEAVIIREICKFIDIDYTPDMLDITHSKEAQSITTRSALWESNSSNPIEANIDKFRKQLSDLELLTIESITSNLMDIYGYEKMTDANLDISQSDIAIAERNSRTNSEAAWKKLEDNNPMDFSLREFRRDYISMLDERLRRKQAHNTL